MSQNYGLGRGLSSLIPQKKQTVSKPQADFNYFGAGGSAVPRADERIAPAALAAAPKGNAGQVLEISLADISPNPFQPRLKFDEAKLTELADSIKEHGILQPLTVTQKGEKYEIIAGERRFQAAKLAGLLKVPVIVKVADDQKKLELAIVENVQRHDLSPIEEAKSFRQLSDEFGLTQEEIAKKLGKNRSSVANKIRLLDLPVEIQRALAEGKITEGHAKLLLAIPNAEKQRAFYELIIKNNLTVRQTEDKTKEITVRHHKRNIAVDPETKEIENNLSSTLGTKVKLKKTGDAGRIVIEYYSREELENILGKIK
jgi:ParB family chromosome partitioning protein